jgi:hypothetical protein
MGGIYEVVAKIGLGAMLYIPSFIKIGSGIHKFIAGEYTDSSSRRAVTSTW